MFLITGRELLGDSNKALNIVFYISAAVLFILLCTVAILHCILRRQQRQYVQSSPRSLIILHISHSVHEKINHDNTVPSIQVSKSTSFPKESGCPFRSSHPTPSSLEKASDEKTSDDNNISKQPTIARPVPSYTPAGQSLNV